MTTEKTTKTATTDKPAEPAAKSKGGRPRKHPAKLPSDSDAPKRGRGRPPREDSPQRVTVVICEEATINVEIVAEVRGLQRGETYEHLGMQARTVLSKQQRLKYDVIRAEMDKRNDPVEQAWWNRQRLGRTSDRKAAKRLGKPVCVVAWHRERRDIAKWGR